MQAAAACSSSPAINVGLGQRAGQRGARRCLRVACNAGGGGGSERQRGGDEPNPGLGLKAVWHGAEALGNVIGATQQRQGGSTAGSAAPAAGQRRLTREEALAAIRADYNENYFVSGRGEMAWAAQDCWYADPFAGFSGTARFKSNVGNLGSLMRDVQLEVTGWEEGEQQLETKWRFSAILDLPWRPRLAAAGGTTHVFDEESGLVVKHIESWDVEPGAVVKSLLKPTAAVPTTFWEVLMRSLHDGDAAGVWFCLSSPVWRAALPASVALAVLHLARGEGLGAWEAAAYIGFVAGLGTELWKVIRNVTGGESG